MIVSNGIERCKLTPQPWQWAFTFGIIFCGSYFALFKIILIIINGCRLSWLFGHFIRATAITATCRHDRLQNSANNNTNNTNYKTFLNMLSIYCWTILSSFHLFALISGFVASYILSENKAYIILTL